MAQAGLGRLLISLDGATSERHESLRGKAGSFDRAIAAIGHAARAGLDVHVVIVASETNVEEAVDIVRIAYGAGARGVQVRPLVVAGNAIFSDVQPAATTAQNGVAAQARILGLRADVVQDSLVNCTCGVTAVTLRPNGDVSLCPYRDDRLGNILETPMHAPWQAAQAARSSHGCVAKLV